MLRLLLFIFVLDLFLFLLLKAGFYPFLTAYFCHCRHTALLILFLVLDAAMRLLGASTTIVFQQRQLLLLLLLLLLILGLVRLLAETLLLGELRRGFHWAGCYQAAIALPAPELLLLANVVN